MNNNRFILKLHSFQGGWCGFECDLISHHCTNKHKRNKSTVYYIYKYLLTFLLRRQVELNGTIIQVIALIKSIMETFVGASSFKQLCFAKISKWNYIVSTGYLFNRQTAELNLYTILIQIYRLNVYRGIQIYAYILICT